MAGGGMAGEPAGTVDWPVREPPNIGMERLYAVLREQYGLDVASVDYLPRGRDYDAGVFRVASRGGGVYLLKLTTRPLYAPAYLVPAFLTEQGISEVAAPVPTMTGALWTTLDEWRAALYPYLDGDTGWSEMTTAQWREVGSTLRRIHDLHPTPEQLERLGPLRRETFDPPGYGDWIRVFEAEQQPSRADGSEVARALRAAWEAHRSAIHAALAALATLGASLRARTLPCVICHADLHASNLLRDRAGRVHVIDWDEVMLAPRERDFIFVRRPPSDAFWEGYGEHAVDWVALAYFQFERAVQDIIEDARQVCCRDDLGETVECDIVRAFEHCFAEDGNLAAAYAVAVHLSPDLGVAHVPPDGPVPG